MRVGVARGAAGARGAAVVTVLLAIVGCGVPTDSAMRPIDIRAIPSGLSATSTSTTTSTTSTSTTSTTAPPRPPPTTTAVAPPITQAPVLEPVLLYFALGDRIVEVTRPMATSPSLDSVVLLLAFGPNLGESAPAARSAVELGDVESVTLSAGVAIVQLSNKFRDLPATEQRRSVAQLVLTLTKRPGVGQVRFQVQGTALPVPRGDGTFGETTVSRDDYLSLLDLPTIVTTSTQPLP